MRTTFQTHTNGELDHQRQPRQTRQLRSTPQSSSSQPNPFDQLDASITLESYLQSIQSESAVGAFAPQTPPPTAFWTQEQAMAGHSMSTLPLMPQYSDWTSSQAGGNGNQPHQHTAPYVQPRAPPAPTAAPGPVQGQAPNLYTQDTLGEAPRGLNTRPAEPNLPNNLPWGPNGSVLAEWSRNVHNGLPIFDQNSMIGDGGLLNAEFPPRMVVPSGQIHLPSPSPSVQSFGSKRDASPIPSDNEKPWACERCPARFSRKRDTERHMRSVHTGEAPYVCKGCKEGFVRSDARGRHWKMDPGCRVLHQGVEDVEREKSRSRMPK